MLPSASALASRREERVQKAFSVDHHGPGDARLSHRATAIYGEHSDYVTINTRGRLDFATFFVLHGGRRRESCSSGFLHGEVSSWWRAYGRDGRG
jgi:hypothetical protein